MDMIEIQKKIYENKVNKGFNVTDVTKEFCLLYGEVGEAYEAYMKKKDDFGEELADIAIYLMGKIIDIFFEGIDFAKIVYIISQKMMK